MPKLSYFQLPQKHQILGYAALAFIGYIIWDQMYWWNQREDYSFGFLVPLFVAFVIYDRWPLVARALIRQPGLEKPDHGILSTEPGSANPKVEQWLEQRQAGKVVDVLAVIILAGACLVFLYFSAIRAASGVFTVASLMTALGFGTILITSVYLISREDSGGEPLTVYRRLGLAFLFLFPGFAWIVSAPLIGVVETKLSLFLLNKVAIVVYTTFDFLGFPIVREGNILRLPKGDVGVAEACSGIRSLTACLFAGSFLGAVFLQALWKKVCLVAAAMVFAFFTNLLRSLFLTAWAYNYGSDAIEGTVHDVTGYAILGLTCVGLLALLPVFSFKLEYEDDEFEEDGDDDGSGSSGDGVSPEDGSGGDGSDDGLDDSGESARDNEPRRNSTP